MGRREMSSNPSRCLVGGAVLDGLRAALIDATSLLLMLAVYVRVGVMQWCSLIKQSHTLGCYYLYVVNCLSLKLTTVVVVAAGM